MIKTIPIVDCSVSSTPVESFRIKKAGGRTDKRDENSGIRWATMIAISEAAADHQQSCELYVRLSPLMMTVTIIYSP